MSLSDVQTLKKIHRIEEELFPRIGDQLRVIESLGASESLEEFARLRQYASHVKKLMSSEQGHLVKHPEELLRFEKEELSLEASLVKLLEKPAQSLSDSQLEVVAEGIEEVISRLREVIAREERALEEAK